MAPNPQFLPREVGIELVRGCNFSCTMCPVTANAPSEEHKFQFIAPDLLRRLASELDHWPSIEYLWFFHFGEPLAHPRYRECLEILAGSWVAQKAKVIQHTNGSLLRGDKAKAILEIPIINKLVFSFDGFGDRESFEQMRGPHYDRVLDNIREFAELARRLRPDLELATASVIPRPGELSLANTPSREEAVARLHEVFAPLGVSVEPRDMHDYNGGDDLKVRGRMPLEVRGGCPFVEKDSLYFTVNGWAQPCCAVYDESFNVGKFDEEAGFGALLNGPEMQQIRHSLRLDQRENLGACSTCRFSLGGVLPEPALRDFWKARDDQGWIGDREERHHVFDEVVPTEHRGLCVDLGCGPVKNPRFVGVDRFPMPGVDLVADLDGRLPFDDDSVDLLYASHSLEHIKSLPNTMEEVYRICKHGAQVVIVAPYHNQSLNLANPYHTQVFNEHTPRFWTASPLTPIPPEEYAHPNSPNWGLLHSDNSGSRMDIRCLRMEFSYFEKYRGLPAEELRELRMARLDVCDQIVYHLIVIKNPVTEEEFRAMANRLEYYEPAYVTVRRLQEANDQQKTQLASAEEQSRVLNGELEARKEQLAASEERSRALNARVDALSGQVETLSGQRDRLQAETARLTPFEETSRNLLAQVQTLSEQREQTQQTLRQTEAALAEARHARQQTEALLAQTQQSLAQSEASLHQTQTDLQVIPVLVEQQDETRAALDAVLASRTYRVARLLRRIRLVLAPPGSLRARFGRMLWDGLRWMRRLGRPVPTAPTPT